MVFAIDIGNTNIVVGCIEKDNILFTERVSTNRTATALEYAVTIKEALSIHGLLASDIDGAIISSVVPQVTNTVKKAIEKFCGVTPLVVGPGIKTGLSIKIDNPAQLGSDLVVDAVAGINEYPLPLIIIDIGKPPSSRNFFGYRVPLTTRITSSLPSRINTSTTLTNKLLKFFF